MRLLSALAVAAFTIAVYADQAKADQSDEWQTTLVPYLWAPTIHGELRFNVPTQAGGAPGPSLGVTVVPSKYLPKLASAFMFAGETKNKHWGVFTDLIYMNLGISNAGVTDISGPGGHLMIPINANTQVRFTSTVWTIAATTPIANCKHFNAEALAGGRYAYLPTSLSWDITGPLGIILNTSGTHYESPSVWDAIVGAKGRVQFGDTHWFVPYYADIGTGDAHLTWQAIGGFGYEANHGQSWNLVYRNLYYDMGTGHFMKNVNLGGAALGYSFKL